MRRYLPDFRTSDPSVAARVTVRQLLNHTAGWLGDDFEDTGTGDDALARYVAGVARLPQLTPPGEVFHYNNAALGVAGRVIEAVTGTTFERAARELVIDPLAWSTPASSRTSSPTSTWPPGTTWHGAGGAGTRVLRAAARVSTRPGGWSPASGTSCATPASISVTAGCPAVGERLLTRRSLTAMRSHPGPGGTLRWSWTGWA